MRTSSLQSFRLTILLLRLTVYIRFLVHGQDGYRMFLCKVELMVIGLKMIRSQIEPFLQFIKISLDKQVP